MNDMQYKPLKIDFEIPIILERTITDYVNNLNTSDGDLEDCYQSEIQSLLNGCDLCLSELQINLLRDYYQFGGIHDSN